jgi:hypothetical protein
MTAPCIHGNRLAVSHGSRFTVHGSRFTAVIAKSFSTLGHDAPLTKLLLYAQPLEAEPFLSKAALKKGEYKEGGGVLGGLPFTDVGRAVHEALDKIYSDFGIDIIESGVGGGWALRITTSQLRLVLTRRAYRSFSGPEGSYITLDFDGDKHAIFRFVKTFLKSLRRPPWEISFPPDFREKAGRKVKEVAADWEKFAEGVSLDKEESGEEDGEKPAKKDEEAVKAARKEEKAAAKAAPEAPKPEPVISLRAGAFIGFEGEGLVLNVRAENSSTVSLEKVQVTPKASSEAVKFGAPAKVISYLKPGEALTLAFPVDVSPDDASGEVWAELEGAAGARKVSARTEPRRMKSPLPELAPAEVATAEWHRRAGALVRRDEVRAKVAMADSEAFDEMLGRVKSTGLALLDPEVIHSGTNYMGHLKMYAEDGRKRRYAFALDCVGDFRESKITLHFYAESAELVMALRERMMAALAGKG